MTLIATDADQVGVALILAGLMLIALSTEV